MAIEANICLVNIYQIQRICLLDFAQVSSLKLGQVFFESLPESDEIILVAIDSERTLVEFEHLFSNQFFVTQLIDFVACLLCIDAHFAEYDALCDHVDVGQRLWSCPFRLLLRSKQIQHFVVLL